MPTNLDFHQVVCEHPTIILNPAVDELVSFHHNYVLRGHRVDVRHNGFLYVDRSELSPKMLKITHEDLENCYIDDVFKDKRYPLYLEVPCGHCDCCRYAKVQAFVHRCKLETQIYNSKPIFITLTYDNNHLKKCGVDVRDVQLFFKRLRINLYRKGYRQKIRYVLVSEYGKHTHRPHYHAILWNLHASNLLSFDAIRKEIENSWNSGFVMSRLVDPGDDKAFYYTAKYLRKDCYIPEGFNKIFMVCSNRGGGIGCQFIQSLRKQFLKTLNVNLNYLNKWNGKTESIMFSRYVIDKLIPSLSKSLPFSIKHRVRRFLHDYRVLEKRCNVNTYVFDRKFVEVYNAFKDYFYCNFPELLYESPDDLLKSDNLILREMLQDEIYIFDYLNKGYKDLSDNVYVHGLRDKFFEKLFRDRHDVDIPARSFKARREFALAAAREVL